MKIRKESIEILERIFSAGKDVYLPSHPGDDAIVFKGSLDGYHVDGRYGLREYDDGEAMYDAFLVIYFDVLKEEDAEGALLRDLQQMDPGRDRSRS